MEKPNTFESIRPLSGQYSCITDLRLNAWLGVATLFYLAGVALVKFNPGLSPLAKALLTLTPLLPGLLYLRTCLRFIRGMDELQRRIQMEAWLFSALGTLIISTIVNTLNANGVTLGDLQHGLSLWGTFALAFALWLVGVAVANCRYK
jgi:hypothetical protein